MLRTVLFTLCLVSGQVLAGGNYWWMNKQNVFSGSQGRGGSSSGHGSPSPSYQGSSSFGSQNQISQGFQSNPNQVSVPSGSCPNIGPVPDVSSCRGEESTCWSVGQPDVDCPGNALCCFDGCRNVCYFGDSSFGVSSRPAAPRRPAVQQPRPQPARRPQTVRRPQPSRQQQSTFVSRPAQQTFHSSRSQPSSPQRYRPQTSQSFTPRRNYQQQQTFSNPQPSAETKPFVKCPSAMKCVQREYCDYEGVMTNNPIPFDPVKDMLRVALIDCINPDTQNVDVCCRDPNYKDPWPNMSGNGNNFNANQGFAPRGASNQGYGQQSYQQHSW